jgi:hypothetical protein
MKEKVVIWIVFILALFLPSRGSADDQGHALNRFISSTSDPPMFDVFQQDYAARLWKAKTSRSKAAMEKGG